MTERIVDWIGADRSQLGDGHTASGATAEDAWLAVHIGGALIFATGECWPAAGRLLGDRLWRAREGRLQSVANWT